MGEKFCVRKDRVSNYAMQQTEKLFRLSDNTVKRTTGTQVLDKTDFTALYFQVLTLRNRLCECFIDLQAPLLMMECWLMFIYPPLLPSFHHSHSLVSRQEFHNAL